MNFEKFIKKLLWVCAGSWLAMIFFGFLDSYFATLSWTEEWMGAIFFYIINGSVAFGFVAAFVALIIFIFNRGNKNGNSN